MTPVDFLTKALEAARESQHIWPEVAASEAALESAWGESHLAKVANNLFGQKQGFTTAGCETCSIPTNEFINGDWVKVDAQWPKFSDWTESFVRRMALLRAMKAYAPALDAETPELYLGRVSKVWATDPLRGEKVLQIYRRHFKNGKVV